jgi:hypothetical protein
MSFDDVNIRGVNWRNAPYGAMVDVLPKQWSSAAAIYCELRAATMITGPLQRLVSCHTPP